MSIAKERAERESNTDVLKLLNIAFENERADRIENEVDSVIRTYLMADARRGDEPLTSAFSVFSNYLKMIIRRKLVNPNFILSSVIKWSRNYVGLFLIGMTIREGANPNVYYNCEGRGNLHILAWTSVARGTGDFLFHYIACLLRMMGSDVFRPALKFEGDSEDVDVRLIEQTFDYTTVEDDYYRAGMNVREYVGQNGYTLEKTLTTFLNSIDDAWLLDMLIASDDVTKFKLISDDWKYLEGIKENNTTLTRFIIDLSVASARKIAASLDDKKYPMLDDTINGQVIPLFAASVSVDVDLFELFIMRGSSVKYVTINTLLTFYKIFKNSEVRLYEWAYQMLNSAVRIGADIDLYQFNFLVSIADYEEIDGIRKSFSVPKWKKLCTSSSGGVDKPMKSARDDFRQIAFKINLDYSLTEEQLCEKFKQIEQIGIDQYFESAIKRQEERVALDVENPATFYGNEGGGEKAAGGGGRPRCDPKTMVLKNPYAFNDAQLAFFKDPKTGTVWCFTSDVFASLISSKTNPYTQEELPQKFLQTIKAQLNTLKELGVYETNEDIKDALKEFYTRSVINNKKTDLQYNTIMKVLSTYGVSQERFESLRSETLNDTILKSIAGVNLINFGVLPMILKQRTTTRILYSLAKNDTPMARESGQISDDLSKELFTRIAVAISGDIYQPEEYEYGPPLPEDDYDQIIGGNY